MTHEERLATFLGRSPRLDPTAWIHRSAVLLGDVTIGPDSSVFPGCVLRADIQSIVIGARSNLQDGTIVHLADDLGVEVGDDVTVGHGALLHACRVEDGALIGMRATVLDGAVIGRDSLVGAGAVVPKGLVVPPGSLVLGLPGKVIRALRPEEIAANRELAAKYVIVARAHRARGS